MGHYYTMHTTQTTTTGDLATFGQVAETLKIHTSTLRRLWRSGAIPGYRIGHRTIRLSLREVTQALRVGKSEGGQP